MVPITPTCDTPGKPQQGCDEPQGASGRRRRSDDRRRGYAATFTAAALAFLATPANADLAAYLRARAADGAGQGDTALAAYRAAMASGSPLVAIRAYREALAAGDLTLARQAAAVLRRVGLAPADTGLLTLADAARAGDPAALVKATTALEADRLRLLVPSLTAIAGGKPTDPADPSARRLLAETRALLLIGQGPSATGIAAATPLTGASFRIAAAELLLAADNEPEARRIVGNDPAAFAAARAGASAAGLAHGVSRLLLRIADDLDDATSSPLAIALARAALIADPGYQRAHLVLAEQLARADDAPRALAELALVPADSPLAGRVAVQRVEILNRSDRLADAVAAARLLAEREGATARDQARYADLLFADNRPADALPLYKRVLRGREAKDSWAAWLRYGGALDEAGRWRDAEKALRRAVKIAPEEPSALNYLGYTLVDRREDVAEGTAMLERAYKLAPDDAAIADSLGWAYHRAGETARALPLVETAAIGMPADAEVNDHLGDIYWTLGRRFEARYAWAAARLTAAPDARARIAAKIDAGL